MSRTTNKKNSASPILDVIVTTGGRFEMLRKCLASLETQTNRALFNVYLVDNASDNEDRLRNKDIFEMEIVTQSKRLTQAIGFPAMANEGARMGKAPLIMFLSDDVELMPDVIDKVVRRMDDIEIGVVGIKLLFPLDSVSPGRPAGRVQHVGHGVTINGDIVHPLMGWEANNPKCCISRDTVSVTGACYTIRRGLFGQVGGFLTDYGYGTFEDVDMSFNVRSLGKRVFVDTEAIGYHYVGATVEKKNTAYPLLQNSMIFKARWSPTNLFHWDDWTFY